MIKIEQKYSYSPNKNIKQQKSIQKPNFTGSENSAIKALDKAEEVLISETLIKHHLGAPGKVLNYLSASVGEIQNILFIGFGTAFIAPIFIAFNPLAKQDDKTKKYSALRQPLSAIISVATGLGINMPIATALNKMAAEGKLEKFNMEAKPPSEFVKNKYNNIIKHFDKLKTEDEKYLNMVNDGSINSLHAFKEKFHSYKEFESHLHEVTLGKAADKLLDLNNKESIRNQTVKNFLIKNLGFEIDIKDKNILNPDLVKSKLKDITTIDFLKTFGYSDKMLDEDTLRTFVNDNFYREKFITQSEEDTKVAREMFDLFKKTINANQLETPHLKDIETFFIKKLSKRGFDSPERKAITRMAEMLISESEKKKETILLKNLFKILDIDKNFHENQGLLNMTVDKFLLFIKENMNIQKNTTSLEEWLCKKPIEITDIQKNKFIRECAINIAKNTATNAESALKSYNKLQGIILSLIVLPFSCGILNWSYPRIMEKCFPNLTAKKADNKGGK